MKRQCSFLQAFIESLRLQAPYWLGLLILDSIGLALDSALFNAALMLLLAYLCIGACVVFWLLGDELKLNPQRIDFIGAYRNLNRAARWPWHLWRRLTER